MSILLLLVIGCGRSSKSTVVQQNKVTPLPSPDTGNDNVPFSLVPIQHPVDGDSDGVVPDSVSVDDHNKVQEVVNEAVVPE